MSDVQHTAAPVEAPIATEPVVAQPEETTTAAENVESPETAVAEETPAVAAPAETTEVPATEAPVTEAAATEEIPAETAATTEAPVTEAAATEETPIIATEEPKVIESGVLGYKAPGLIKSFKFSKRAFWLGEEPVSTQGLSTYLRGEKPETGHPTAAWSSQTGKGLLFYVKHVDDDKKHPAGVLNLSEASDLEKDSPHEFVFKLHGHKHSFKATTDAERDGWYVSIEKAIAEAKASKETITSSEGYKEALAGLTKTHSVPAAAVGRKSTDQSRPRATSTSSSSSSEAEAAAEKAKKEKKSRSASRGKRTSIFGNFLNKKEEHDIKKDEKKEEKAEAKAEETEQPATEAAETVPALDAEATATRVVDAPVEEPKPTVDEAVAAEAAPVEAAPVEAAPVEAAPVEAEAVPAGVVEVPVAESAPAVEAAAVAAETKAAEKPVEEKKVTEDRPKTTKRSSIFGSFFDKVRSPTSEKKESEVGPAVPPKETVVSAEPPVIPEPATETSASLDPSTEVAPVVPAEPVVEAPKEIKAESPKVEAPVAPQNERKQSFFGGIVNKVRAKSPANVERAAPASTEAAPAVPPKDDEVVAAAETETPAAAVPVTEPVADKPAEKAIEEPVTAAETPKIATPKENRRKSYFGGFGGAKKDKTEAESPDAEKSFPSKITSLFRTKSQAVRGSKKENTVPAAETKTTEPTPVAETTTSEPLTEVTEPTETSAVAEAKAEEEPKIVEAVPETAATTEEHPTANTTVSAAA